MNNLVSVIIPIYKVECYLRRCVDSILQQTHKNLEIFLVNDGSPDNCGKICDDYASVDTRIKVIHKQNGGLSDARNVAIDVATGEWLVFVDSDDFVAVDYIETLFNLVTKNSCKIGVSGRCSFIDGTEPAPNFKEQRCGCVDKYEALRMMFYQEKMENTAWGKIYHKSLFSSGIRYPYGLIYEDLPTTYKLFLKSDKIAYSNKETYYYLIRKESLEGQTFSSKKFESALIILKMILDDAEPLKPVEKAVRCRLFSFCFHILLEMPDGYNDDRKELLSNYVKANRVKVLFDLHARKKARIAAILSLFGRKIMKKALSFVKQRS